MNTKHYVGGAVSQFQDLGVLPAVSQVKLLVDDENYYVAPAGGDDSGYTIEAFCPSATQAMANSILAQLKPCKYQGYKASSATISPEAELGDGVTVKGMYGMIALQDIHFGATHTESLEAPSEDLFNKKYPFVSETKRESARDIKKARSLISQALDEIRLEVFGEDGYTGTSIVAQLGAVTAAVNGKINGEDAQALIEAALEGITLSVTNGSTSSTIKLKAGETELSSQTIKMNGLVTITGLSGGTTTIDGACIKTGTISADRIDTEHLEVDAANVTGELNADFVTINGMLYIERSDMWGTAAGYIGANTDKGAIVMAAANKGVGCVVNNVAAKLSYYEQKMIWVHSGGCYSSETMQIYSDRSLKHDISYELEREAELFPKLRPCSFVYNQDDEGKLHWGFVAQDFIEAATDAGYDPSTLAVLGQYEGKYSIGYGEVTALNTLMIQKLMTRVSYLERRMEV